MCIAWLVYMDKWAYNLARTSKCTHVPFCTALSAPGPVVPGYGLTQLDCLSFMLLHKKLPGCRHWQMF